MIRIRLLIIFSFATSVCFGQQDSLTETSSFDPVIENTKIDVCLDPNDFKLVNGRMTVVKQCQVFTETSVENVNISVISQLKAFNNIGIDGINRMIAIANEKVRNALNAEHRYFPFEIKMSFMPGSNDWSLTNSFRFQDEIGEVRERLMAVEFDTHGNFVCVKNIL